MVDSITDDIKKIVVNKQSNYIHKKIIGIVTTNDCSMTILNCIYHCMNNKDIFDKYEFNNIINLVNEINYGK